MNILFHGSPSEDCDLIFYLFVLELSTPDEPADARTCAGMSKVRVFWTFSRPFTLVPPMVGIFSGSLIGYGATHVRFPAVHVVLAILAAALLNAASNGLNQICDLENDRINKASRPLPSAELTPRDAWTFVIAAYGVALALVAPVNAETFAIYVIAAVATVLYSAPPARLKRHPIASNLVIALIRGELLKVAGWAAVATVLRSLEPWYIGFVYFVFLLGATTTKDFADIEGDRAAGCITLPVRYGAVWAARAISPSFILPWLILAAGVWLRVLTGNGPPILALSAILLVWGSYVIYLMNQHPERLISEGENHPSWRHMYWMMMVGHLGVAAAYLLR
jgi:4-hydroxybenzoate polyprenyltransferase